jgi:phage repressor protein C with HTH and peptisase S24 domain
MARFFQRRQDVGWMLISDNGAYQPDTVDKAAAGEVTVIRRVVYVGGPA